MGRVDAVARLEARIGEAALDPTQWPGVIGDIAGAVGARSGVLYVHDFKRHLSKTLGGYEIDGALLGEYEAYFSGIDPWHAKVMTWPVCRAAPTTALISDADLKRTEFYNDFLRRTDMFYGLGGVADRDGSRLAVFGIQRPFRAADFTDLQTRMIGHLMPHLRRALRVHHVLAGLAAQRMMLEDTLDLVPRPILVVDGDGRIIFANAAGRRVLESGDGLKLQAGRLTAAHRGDQAGFTAALQALHRRETPSTALTLRRPHRRPAIMLLAMPLQPRPGDDGATRIALLIDADMAPPRPLDRLARLFHLTPAETRLWTAIAGGYTLADIAARNGVSVNTLRVQLASLSRKTGTHRQADLVRLAQGFRSLPEGMGH